MKDFVKYVHKGVDANGHIRTGKDTCFGVSPSGPALSHVSIVVEMADSIFADTCFLSLNK